MKEEAYKPLTASELLDVFEIPKNEEKMLLDILDDMEEKGLIIRNRRDCYGVPERMGMVVGRLQGNAKGFAFLIPEKPDIEDVYVNLKDLKGAMHNDKVIVRVAKNTDGKKLSGEVVRILERANTKVVGNYDQSKNFGFVVPDDNKIYHDIFIPKSQTSGAKDGQKVVAEITRWPEERRNPEGSIVEILGDKGDPGVDIEAIIRNLDLPDDFPNAVKEEMKLIDDYIPESEVKRRRDLRELRMVTIDGEDAKDYDDAVSLEILDNGKARLGVHIADVTYYVNEGSALNSEAYNRATSIYLVDRVIPMLPEKLSNNLCSLISGVDRLAMTVFMDFDLEDGNLVDYEITESIINVNHRLTYTKVNRMLTDGDEELIEEYKDVIEDLRVMEELAAKIREARFDRGSIDFDFPESKVILDDEGRPIDIIKVDRGVSERIIEEFMIRTNEVVAESVYYREIPFIYRVHDTPKMTKLENANAFIHNLGYSIKGLGDNLHPKALQDLLEEVKGKDEERVVNTVLLRSMQQAHYSPENIGHFGLASRCYSHFTSPIRRYPDLTIHRVIKEVINEGYINEERADELQETLYRISDHSSVQERKAMDAERESVDLKMVEYMQDKIGEVYDGIISGVMSFACFVELENGVEGMVHVSSLRDDYYHYYEDKHAFIGERTAKVYKLGDKVKVKVRRVNLDEKEIDFDLVIEEG